MRASCENCNSSYELSVLHTAKAACPLCGHIQAPRTDNSENTVPHEDTVDHEADAPAKTMVYFPDAQLKDDPITAIQHAIQGKTKLNPQESQVSLQVLEGDQVGSIISLSKDRSVIGRGKNSDVAIRDPEISGIHCAIEIYDTVTVIKDLGSTNGTVLNGFVVKEDFLKDGDKIQVGGTTLQFHRKS